MKILSVNSGSSSLKFKLFNMPSKEEILSGVFERIGLDNSFYTIKINNKEIEKNKVIKNHENAVNILLKELINNNVIKSLDEISGVGHRVVHGGDLFFDSVIMNSKKLKQLEKFNDLAPLHNPSNILGIRAFMSEIPNAIEVACFDTAFHHTIEKDKYLYSLPYKYYKKYKIRKYGFHGMSIKYVTKRMKKILNKDNLNLIICHLGNGGSITAIKNSKSYNTSMGFTPNSGIIMSSRSGDIDYSIIPYLMKKENISIEKIDKILNFESGLYGISEISTDCRDIVKEIKNNNEQAILSNKMFVNSVTEYIGKYFMELKKIDAIVFTGGIGENNIYFRGSVVKNLDALNIYLDNEKNTNTTGIEGIISTTDSSIPCFVVPTNEELMIAKDVYDLIEVNKNAKENI